MPLSMTTAGRKDASIRGGFRCVTAAKIQDQLGASAHDRRRPAARQAMIRPSDTKSSSSLPPIYRMIPLLLLERVAERVGRKLGRHEMDWVFAFAFPQSAAATLFMINSSHAPIATCHSRTIPYLNN